MKARHNAVWLGLGMLWAGCGGVRQPYAALRPQATIAVGGTADWVLVTDQAVWLAATKPDAIVRVDPRTNQVVARVAIPGEACAGLAAGFGGVWAPLCGPHPMLARVNAATNRLAAVYPVGPAGPEGGVAASADSVWMAVDKAGTLARIDPATGAVRQRVEVASGSFNPIVRGDVVWVTSVEHSLVTAVDAGTGRVLGTTATGPRPRFLTASDDSIWTLNQGDGSLTRVDAATRRVEATVAAGAAGTGGDVAYGDGAVWATVFRLPLTRVDAERNRIERQWTGTGGDSLRVGFGAVWITDYRKGTLLRLPLEAVR